MFDEFDLLIFIHWICLMTAVASVVRIMTSNQDHFEAVTLTQLRSPGLFPLIAPGISCLPFGHLLSSVSSIHPKCLRGWHPRLRPIHKHRKFLVNFQPEVHSYVLMLSELYLSPMAFRYHLTHKAPTM